MSLAGENLGRSANLQTRADAVHNAGVARFTDPADSTIAYAHIGLVDAGVVEDENRRDDEIRCPVFAARGRRLSHTVADYLAAAEFCLVPVMREVFLHAHDQLRIGETHTIPGGRAEVICVGAAG